MSDPGTRLPGWVRDLDHRVIEIMRGYGLAILRVALGVVFVWFGALKVFDVSPIADFVAKSLPFLPARVALLSMGVLELVIGAGLLTGWAIRVTLLLFFAQMAGTLSTLLLRPGDMFLDGNPLLLSTLGEFVVKNLVLIAAGMVIVASVPKAKPNERLPDLLKGKARSRVPGAGTSGTRPGRSSRRR